MNPSIIPLPALPGSSPTPPAPVKPVAPAADPTVIALAKSIRDRESGGDYTKVGDAGTSAGGFQWSNNGVALKPGEAPANFKAAAQKFLGNANADFSEDNQKAVAYAQINEWKGQGLNPAQIAAKWNSGSESGWENKVGTTTINGKQVAYNVPAYVKAVTDSYQKYKASGSAGAADSSVPTPPAATPPFQYPVAPTEQDRQNKIAGYQADAATAADESKKANSFVGMATNFGKALVSNLFGSEVGLGTTIGQTLAAPSVTKNLTEANQLKSDTQTALIKQIRADKAAGKDTTRLEQTYNSVYGGADNTPSVSDIVPAINKTNGQVAGELGGTALDLLSAGTYGKVATEGMEAGKLASKTNAFKAAATAVSPELGKISEQTSKGLFSIPGVKNIATGTGLGYAQDVTQGLQGNRGENRTGVASLIPGLNTAVGAAIPFASEAVQTGKNAFNKEIKATNAIEQRKKELGVLDDYASVSKRVDKAKNMGVDVKDYVASKDLLVGAVDKNGVINTKGEGNAVDQMQQFLKPSEDVISNHLKNEGVSLPAATVQKKLEYEVNQSGLKGGAKIRALNEVAQDMEGYKLDANKDGSIPLSVIHDAKIDKYSNINFMTDAEKQKSAKAIARGLKTLVEDNTKSVDVGNINKELSKYYTVIDYLESLDGKRVEGGRLGKYFAKTVGAMVGGHAGPLGAIAGAELAGALKGNSMAKTFGTKIGSNPEFSAMMKDAIERGNTTKLKVNSLPSDYTNEIPTIPFGQTPKPKGSNLPVAEGTPKVYTPPEKPRTVFGKAPTGEPYVPPSQLPTIQMGPKAKAPVSNLPVATGAPKVFNAKPDKAPKKTSFGKKK